MHVENSNRFWLGFSFCFAWGRALREGGILLPLSRHFGREFETSCLKRRLV
jgi:hypothetical protein